MDFTTASMTSHAEIFLLKVDWYACFAVFLGFYIDVVFGHSAEHADALMNGVVNKVDVITQRS